MKRTGYQACVIQQPFGRMKADAQNFHTCIDKQGNNIRNPVMASSMRKWLVFPFKEKLFKFCVFDYQCRVNPGTFGSQPDNFLCSKN